MTKPNRLFSFLKNQKMEKLKLLMQKVLKRLKKGFHRLKGQNGVILPSLDQITMVMFLEIQKTQNLKLLNAKANQKELENHWSNLYDEYWRLKDDPFAKSLLRREDEIKIKETKLLLLFTLRDAIVSFLRNPELKIDPIQKAEIIRLYSKNTKNSIDKNILLPDLFNKIESSITNFKNAVDKSRKENNHNATNEISNNFLVVARVLTVLNMPLSIQQITVTEFLAYEKIAKEKLKSDEQR